MWMRKVLQKKRKGERRKSSSITDVKLLLAGDWMEKFRPPYIYGKEGEGGGSRTKSFSFLVGLSVIALGLVNQ